MCVWNVLFVKYFAITLSLDNELYKIHQCVELIECISLNYYQKKGFGNKVEVIID